MRYLHHIPGRIRLRAEALKGNSSCAHAIAAWLGSVYGVERVQLNPVTGSVLIYYRPEATDGDDLIAQCREFLSTSYWTQTSRTQTSASRFRRPLGISEETQRTAAKLVAGYVAQVVIERSLSALVAALF